MGAPSLNLATAFISSPVISPHPRRWQSHVEFPGAQCARTSNTSYPVAIRAVERPISEPFRPSHRETTVLRLLAVALSCHSERSEESLILLALFVLAPLSKPFGPAHRERTVLRLLAVALSCHSERSEESLNLLALSVLAPLSKPFGPCSSWENCIAVACRGLKLSF